jgi:hypothetical protein
MQYLQNLRFLHFGSGGLRGCSPAAHLECAPAWKKPRHRVQDNIKMEFNKIRGKGLGWIHVAGDGEKWSVLINMVMKLRVPKSGEFLD